jgi:probable rRNA maturation factor
MNQKTLFLINFYFQKRAVLKNRKELKQFLSQILEKESKYLGGNLNFIFCQDKDLLEINKKFLEHDFYTDIITFNLSERGTNFLQAEIYISVDRVRDNAQKLTISFYKELHRVIFHGILHLCGYEDTTKEDISIMRENENLYLGKYFGNNS